MRTAPHAAKLVATRATLPARGTRPSAHPEQLAMTLPLLAERPGSQLDLIAEAGTETIGPSTLVEAPAPTTLF